MQVGKKLLLLGIGSLVEDCLGGSDVLLRLGLIPAPGSDAGLRVFPTKLPQVLPGGFDVGFLETSVVAHLIPVIGGVQIA